MKRFSQTLPILPTACVIFLVFFAAILPAPAENLQIVMPKTAFVGDTVEIHYIFDWDSDFFSAERAASLGLNAHRLELNPKYAFSALDSENFALKNVLLEKNGGQYTLSLTIVPWKAGFLQISGFDLGSFITFSHPKLEAAPFYVLLEPIEVKSLVQKTGNHSFLPAASPLILPGTTALLATLAILALIFFGTLLFALLHIPKIVRFLENLAYLYALKKNSRKAIKKIRTLKSDSEKIFSDKDFAETLEHILRDFLTKRFARDFSSVTTNALSPLFDDLCGGNLDAGQEAIVENLVALFSRFDFVRFSENAQFLSERENGGTKERKTLCEKSIQIIEDFDKDENSDSQGEKL